MTQLTFYKDLYSQSFYKSLSFKNLESLSRHILFEGPKSQSPRFASGAFKNGSRGQKSFLKTSLLILDFDSGLRLEQAKEIFKSYRCIIAPTLSHSESLHKFRVILALDKEITNVRDYRATAQQFKKHNYDTSSEIASQLWAFSKSIYFINNTGSPCSAVEAPEEKRQFSCAAASGGQKRRLSKRFWRFWNENAGDGERYRERLYCATELLSQNYSLEQAISIIEKSKAHNDEQKQKWIKILDGVFKREYRFDFRPKNNVKLSPEVLLLRKLKEEENYLKDIEEKKKYNESFLIALFKSLSESNPELLSQHELEKLNESFIYKNTDD